MITAEREQTREEKAAEIRQAMGHCYGTDGYHRLTLSRKVLATDGVETVCRLAKAYWLVDAIGSYVMFWSKYTAKDRRLADMAFWKLRCAGEGSDRSARLECWADSGEGEKPVIVQKIEYTDFPLDEIDIWQEIGETAEGICWVLLLPSEH